MTELLTRKESTRDRIPGNIIMGCDSSNMRLKSLILPPDSAHNASRPVHEDIIPAITFALPRNLASSEIEAMSLSSFLRGSRTFVRSDSTTPSADGPRRGGSGYRKRRVEGSSEMYSIEYNNVVDNSGGPSSNVCSNGRKPADRITKGVSNTTTVTIEYQWGIQNSASVSAATAPNRSSPWEPISAIATTALTTPCVRKVIPCGISRKTRSNFSACSLSALCEGGRDNDLRLIKSC